MASIYRFYPLSFIHAETTGKSMLEGLYLWAELCFTPYLFAEALTPQYDCIGDDTFKEVILRLTDIIRVGS